MGRRGPKPKPKEARKAEGTFREDRHGGPDMPVPESIPEPPDFLGKEAKQCWQRTGQLLFKRKLLTEADVMSFALLCQAWDDFVKATKEVDEFGMTAMTDNGNLIQHPSMGIANKAWQRVLTGCREFGLTPSARTGMPLDDTSDADREAEEVVGL